MMEVRGESDQDCFGFANIDQQLTVHKTLIKSYMQYVPAFSLISPIFKACNTKRSELSIESLVCWWLFPKLIFHPVEQKEVKKGIKQTT